jgi:DNA-binding HxlR family transcriptional regulator
MRRVKGYGQFCPVAKAAEILTERWTPLVIRELLLGSTHFNDLRRGVPLMSPSLLSQRLKTLEDAGIVVRHRSRTPRGFEYRLTSAGKELQPIVELLGLWGHRWVEHELTGAELDPSLVMWDMRRRVHGERLPSRRVVVRFEFASAPGGKRLWWLVLQRNDVDVCLRDPGYPVDLTVATDVRSLTRVWVGQDSFDAASKSGRIRLSGPRELVKRFGSWLKLSMFAAVDRKLPVVESLGSVE